MEGGKNFREIPASCNKGKSFVVWKQKKKIGRQEDGERRKWKIKRLPLLSHSLHSLMPMVSQSHGRKHMRIEERERIRYHK